MRDIAGSSGKLVELSIRKLVEMHLDKLTEASSAIFLGNALIVLDLNLLNVFAAFSSSVEVLKMTKTRSVGYYPN